MSTRHVIPVVTGSRAAGSPDIGPASVPADPLDLLVGHLKGLIRVDGVAFLGVDGERGSIEPAASWFASPDVRDAIEPAIARSFDRTLPTLVEAAIGRRSALLLSRVSNSRLAPRLRADFERDPAAMPDAWPTFAASSVIVCPIRTATGRPRGVLLAASVGHRRPLREAALQAVEVIADLAALALERAQLLAVEGARAHRELLLKRAAEDVSGSLESEEVYRRILAHAVDLTGAEHGLLSRLQPGTSRLIDAAVSGTADEGSFARAILGEVASRRSAVMRPQSIHVPMDLGPRLFGVLSVTRAQPPGFEDPDLELLRELARLGAAAIANAIDFERERQISRALTRGFVPTSVPEVPGYELGVLWEPAESQPTGGDLYGVWPLPTGEVAVLVGDVAGKGVETAALSAMARFFIEARSWDAECPAAVLAQANAMLRGRLPSETFVTAFFALLTSDGLRCASAGHLCPLLLREGDAEPTAAGAVGLPLGVEAEVVYETHTVDFAPGDLMLAFTDGVVEARRDGQLFGAERLEAALVAASAEPGDLDRLVGRVHAEASGWARGLSDDAVLLAVRRRHRGRARGGAARTPPANANSGRGEIRPSC